MIHVACSGFGGPVSLYWKVFSGLEISDTETALPGEGSLRRWQRESIKPFVFTMLAPKQIAADGFVAHDPKASGLAALAPLAKDLAAPAIVFVASPEFKNTKQNRESISGFLQKYPKTLPIPVLDLRGFSEAEALELCGDTRAIPALNPTTSRAAATGKLAYFRLHGPSGPKSRYDDDALKRVAKTLLASKAATTIVVFANVDMQANGTTLRRLLTDAAEPT